MASDSSFESKHPMAAAPNRKSRWLIGAVICGFLLFQIITPLSYYLGGGGPDERFSWRMFSSVRMRECQVALYETTERDGRQIEQFVPLETILQSVWIKRLNRDQPAVVRKFLRWRCQQPGVKQLRYEMRCIMPDGTRLPVKRLIVDSQSDCIGPMEATP